MRFTVYVKSRKISRSVCRSSTATTWFIVICSRATVKNLWKTTDLIVLYSGRQNTWKLADFGLTASSTSRENYMPQSHRRRGASTYRAPEMLSEHPRYRSKVDIWSMGCILYELVSLESAINVKSVSTHLTATFQKPFQRLFSVFILDMLCMDPHKRPSARELQELFRELRHSCETPKNQPSSWTQADSPSYVGDRPTSHQNIWLLTRPIDYLRFSSIGKSGSYDALQHWGLLITEHSGVNIQAMLKAGPSADDDTLGTISELNCPKHGITEVSVSRTITVSTFRRKWRFFATQYVGITEMTNDNIQAIGTFPSQSI